MERKIIQEFIEIYRSEPSLWKVRCSNYNNKAIKNMAYNRMVLKLRELYPNADIDMVKKKINALRTNYRKELRKVDASKERNRLTGEPIYMPSLWYYDLFHFIADQEEDQELDMNDEVNVNDLLHVDFDDSVQYEGGDSDVSFDEEYQVSSPESMKNSDPSSSQVINMDGRMMMQVPQSYKRKREDYCKNDDEWGEYTAKRPTLPPEPPLDELDYFGRYVASKLKVMDKPMQMLSERIISEVLFKGQMGWLNKNSTISGNDISVIIPDGEVVKVEDNN